MGYSINNDNEWTVELEQDGESFEVTFEYSRSELEDRVAYRNAIMGDGESDEIDEGDVLTAAVDLARKCTDAVRGLDIPCSWDDGESLAEHFGVDSGRQARNLILTHLGDTYPERNENLRMYVHSILDVDKLTDELKKTLEENSGDE